MVISILDNGIDMGTTSKLQELKLLVDMHRFINNRGKLRSYIDEKKITIETLWFDPLVSVEIESGIMSIIPVTDDGFYDALSEIIYFITFFEMKGKKPIKPTKKTEKKPKIDPHEFDWI